MTFVKSASGVAVAVVRTADMKVLLAEPATYWDLTLLKLSPDTKVTRLEIRRTDGTFTLARDDKGEWRLTAPLSAEANTDQVNKVLDHVERLVANRIVHLGTDVPESFAKAKDIMQVVVTTSETPPTTQPATKPTTGPAATKPAAAKPAASKPAATKPATTKPAATRPATQPIAKTCQFTIAKTGLHSYAWLAGQKLLTVGEFAPSLYDDLAGELRGRKVWSLTPEKIRAVLIEADKDSLELKRDGPNWVYTADPYVKIDAEKVNTFLKDVKEVTAEKFAAHQTPADVSKFGLAKPWMTVALTDEGGTASRLSVSNEGATKTKDRYAQASTVPGVFVLSASSIDKMTKTLKDFRK